MITKLISALITVAVCFGIGVVPNLVNKSPERRETVKTAKITEIIPAAMTETHLAAEARSGDVLIEAIRAEKIALQHLGFAQDDVYFDRTELDYERGQALWEVELRHEYSEYDLVIDAVTGEVLYVENDREGKLPAQTEPSPVTTELTEEEALKTALDHAGLTSEQTKRLRINKDRDDGIWVYEIEFVEGFTEYDYSIRVSDGTIVDFDKDFGE